MTPYSNITKRFTRKIKKDKKFFSYGVKTSDELLELINQRCNDLLDDAVNELQPQIVDEQDVDFLDKNDTLEQFNFDLIPVEEDLISDLMVLKLFDEESLELKAKQKYLGKGIEVFSPAKERDSFFNMLDKKKSAFNQKLGSYNQYDRKTGKMLLPY